jgi:hypothetical protein
MPLLPPTETSEGMKKLFAALLGSVVLFGVVSAANAQDVYIRSRTPDVTQKALRNDLVAFQTGQNKLERWWGGEHAVLKLGNAPKDGKSWQITLLGVPQPFAPLGYHFLSPYGPYALVWYTWDWPVTLSHELFEMFVDPNLDRTVQGTRLWLVEVADPVEMFSFKVHTKDGSYVPISDFVGPGWYDPHSGGPYDYMHAVRRPELLLPGGYASFWDGTDWNSIER